MPIGYYATSFFVGLGLAALFGILAGVDAGNRPAYIGAAITAGLAGIVGGIMYLVKK
ncbi:MAG: hypothetical protein ACREU9_07935 [Gammaproteobacteria bacterium]